MALTLLFLAVVMVGVGLGIGYTMGKNDRLDSRDRKRLQAAESLIDSLQADAADYVVMGEKFPVVVLDEVRNFNRRAVT